MAMVVKNNLSAKMTLGELNKNVNKAGQLLTKIASGEKIVSAKDDAANYAISEKMREQIRSLTQDNQNVQNGSSLFRIAEGGIDNIVEELRNLKELAINAANDTNTDADRQTIQKEFNHKIANINDIATMTNYNGKILLDGTYGKHFVEEGYTTETITEKVLKEVIVGQSDTTITSVNGDPIPLTAGDWNIKNSGVYMLKSGFTGNLFIDDNLAPDANGVVGVKFVQETSAELNDVFITGPENGGANLWIEDLNIRNSKSKNFVNFQGADNYLNFKGTNNIYKVGSTSNGAAIIHVGEGTTVVEGGKDGTGIFNFSGSGLQYGAFIGSDMSEDLSGRNILINNGTYNNYAFNVGTAFIGSAIFGKIGDITIESGSFADNYSDRCSDALIGGGGSVGNVSINYAKIYALYKQIDPVIGVTNMEIEDTIGNITIKNSEIHCNESGNSNFGAPAIGPSGYGNNSKSGNIEIDNCILDINVSGGAAGIGTGVGSTVDGNIKITNTDLSNVTATGGGEAIGAGLRGTVTGNISISGEDGFTEIVWPTNPPPHSGKNEPENSSDTSITAVQVVTALQETEVTRTVEIKNPGVWEWSPLKIHHGPKDNQATNFYINDMHTKSLGTKNLVDGTNFENEDDEARYWALSVNKKLQAEWLKTLEAAQNKNLDDILVTTKKDANVAIRVLDGAIDYALNESTRMGAYLQRLDYTGSNLVTMNENVQGAESTIRDADMAKEMTDYTKANVLVQSAQAMLAQANQNSSAVLSLLQ